MSEALRHLPQVDAVLRDVEALREVGPHVGRWLVRREVDAARRRARAGAEPGDVAGAVERAVASLRTRAIRPVINATGVVLHTNLGRAPLSPAAIDSVVSAAGAAALEYDVQTGERSARAPVAATLAAALCDAEDALIVNNNAAALLLVLAALARGREAIVSRGELIEIGGEFRLPDVMEASGARMREVGTTNRTHAKDYRAAFGPDTALILKVHPSNFRVVGFTAQPALADLVEAAGEAGVPLVFDIGSGLLRPDDAFPDEPDATGALAAGCDLVTFSGDKLLGGPQAGVIAGRAALVERCRRSSIARAVRADKLSLAALEATLWAHARGEPVPARTMATAPLAEMERRARALAGTVAGAEVIAGTSVIGAGSVPGSELPTALVCITTDHPERGAAILRTHEPPVIARVERGRLLLDLRTVPPEADAIVLDALRTLV